jgi:hypothetical protein
MSGILQSALGGGRALLVGWFLPSFINVLVFGLAVAPGLSGFRALAAPQGGEPVRATVFALVATAVLGLVLAALQTPLYRVLEGYLAWPRAAFGWGRARQLARKYLLRNRLEAARLVAAEAAGELSSSQAQTLAAFRAHPVTGRFVAADAQRGQVWLSLLEERLGRYPTRDHEVTPTRLGNAIRRFEEYGFDRFRLDSQVFWHELNAVVCEPARTQAETARVNVDFFVCLLYGHLLVAAGAGCRLIAAPRVWWPLAVAAGALSLLAILWYHVAVVATDEWAAAVRALVNLGRAPLATALGLALPDSIARERTMWALAAEHAQTPYDPAQATLDAFRADPHASAGPTPTPD